MVLRTSSTATRKVRPPHVCKVLILLVPLLWSVSSRLLGKQVLPGTFRPRLGYPPTLSLPVGTPSPKAPLSCPLYLEACPVRSTCFLPPWGNELILGPGWRFHVCSCSPLLGARLTRVVIIVPGSGPADRIRLHL